MEEIIVKRIGETEKVKKRFLDESLPQLTSIIRLIADALENGNKVLLFGNGGSAAQAQHLAAEFVNRLFMDRPPLPEGDVAIGISTSGNSANVIKAIEVAKEIGLETVALTGKDGGDLAKVASYSLIVPSSSTPCIQEVHMAIAHILCEMVEAQIFKTAY